ncbi:MAG: hypothetical protein GTO63_34305 [Anaerolineae bacterium]|nr:hypothetical protein [Anaerolineae bacterium]NIN99713.1 hypothetical protein [Anaerolineae bacterium]NIQ82565.1 hypothetical protein [Anaerolineae bacterium]
MSQDNEELLAKRAREAARKASEEETHHGSGYYNDRELGAVMPCDPKQGFGLTQAQLDILERLIKFAEANMGEDHEVPQRGRALFRLFPEERDAVPGLDPEHSDVAPDAPRGDS